ncbi:hypothetical protein JoomaDRAFT_0745 [Galbibacter orientalis DSM 19592]|uniref:Uncharacterized protein n=1 Tax=Galbibacter orientalis DSM 19592 TaxID=926559 RepID=I3C2D6_9FLAO|nr:hypothetical protein [Galbibacter orientalis]EIJ37779.1 hypothetical protein JoomaDRAFT_0745 [Galbibacter orientalis DSM 19592]
MATQRNTKSLAWKQYVASKKRKTAKGKIIQALIQNNNMPLNNRSFSAITGMEMGSVTRAVYDLLNEGVLSFVIKPSIQTGYKVKYCYIKDYNSFVNEEHSV